MLCALPAFAMPEQTTDARQNLNVLFGSIDAFIGAGVKFTLDSLLEACNVPKSDPKFGAYTSVILDYLDLKNDYRDKGQPLERLVNKDFFKAEPIQSFAIGAVLGGGVSYAVRQNAIIAVLSAVLCGVAFVAMDYVFSKRAKESGRIKTAGQRKAQWQLDYYKGEFQAQRAKLIEETLYKLN